MPARALVVINIDVPWCFAKEPDASRPDTVAGRAGCEDLLRDVRRVRPVVHLFGHIHTDGGPWRDDQTTYVNATTSECQRLPTVIDVDVASRVVQEVSVPIASELKS